MTMADYRFIVAGARSNEIVAEFVSVSDMNLNLLLNRPGALSLSVPRDEAALRIGSLTTVYPQTHALYVERDNVVIFGGLIEQVQAKGSDSALTFNATGWWDYYRTRTLSSKRVFTNKDVYSIISDVWAAIARSNKFGNDESTLELRFQSATRGVNRTVTYESWEMKSLASIVEEWSGDSEAEFDFELVCYRKTPETMGRRLHTYHPEISSVAKDTLTFERNPADASAPGTLSDYTFVAMGSQYASGLFGVGRGEGVLKKISKQYADFSAVTSSRINLSELIYREGVYPRGDLGLQSQLDKVTARRLRYTQTPPIALGLTVYRDAITPNQVIRPGNSVNVVINDGYVQVGESQRIVAANVKLEDDMHEVISIQTVRPTLET